MDYKRWRNLYFTSKTYNNINMNKKVLIFWLWFQWKKYIKYFLDNWYIIDWISKTWLNKNNIIWLNEIYSFEYIENKKDFNFVKYNYIIVAIKPYDEQDNVIKSLLEKEIKNKIIIEKPVSYDMDLLYKILQLDNYYFFIDENILWNLYKKVFKNNINNIKFIIYDKSGYNHILEHMIAPFLFFDNFIDILDLIEIKFWKDKKEDTFYYDIIYNNFIINCNKWIINLNSKNIYNLYFKNSLDFLLNLDYIYNKLFKINFLIFRKKYEKNNYS